MSRKAVAAGLLLTALCLLPAAAEEVDLSAVRSFDDCDRIVDLHPDSFRAHRCYRLLSRKTGQHAEAIRRLEARRSVRPGNGLIPLMLASIRYDSGDPDRALVEMGDGIRLLESAGRTRDEIEARLRMRFMLATRGDLAAADAELERAAAVAETLDDERIRVAILIIQAERARERGDDGLALSLFLQVEQRLGPDGSPNQRAITYSRIGGVYLTLNRYEPAMRYFEREIALRRELGDRYAEAISMDNYLRCLFYTGRTPAAELRPMIERSVETARELGNGPIEAAMLRMLSEIESDQAARIDLLTRSAELARRLRLNGELSLSLTLLAEATLSTDTETAFEHIENATRLAKTRGYSPRWAHALAIKAHMRRQIGPREDALADSLAALDAVEMLRTLHSDDEVRTTHFERWSGVYYSAAAYILGDPRGLPDDEAMEAAHRVIERMRSRRLLDHLDRTRSATVSGAAPELEARRRAALNQIALIQRDLLDPELENDARERLLADLTQRELDEREARALLVREDPRFARLEQPEIPELKQLRQSLSPGQAVLSYQLFRADTSALLVHTAGESRVYPMPTRDEAEAAVRLYIGSLERRDELEGELAARLHGMLLADALDDLPGEVTRLLIVPDGPLQRLPFHALREGPESAPLARRYAIGVAPSISTWMRLRNTPSEAGNAVLALADPELRAEQSETSSLRAWSLDRVGGLGSLPHARREAAAAVRRLGSGSELHTGASASEHLIKTEDLTGFRMIHFAAHALLDDSHPERASLLLTPGDPGEDGLLQVREIVELGLDGQVVVLAACKSAAGREVMGEGVVGLSHAFFQAGARAVIGGLWPLRDDETERLIDGMYAELARGASVVDALGAARRRALDAGEPAAAWSGVVVIGDGDYVPLPGGSAAGKARRIIGAGLLLVVALGLFLLSRRRGTQRFSAVASNNPLNSP
ncbi:hypothetical protein ABI59_06455 [Acidobacteria bacterium Mor1]|nr:hypothetical protein ABI59_06455 [Acidobacteria bacterium Mor1]